MKFVPVKVTTVPLGPLVGENDVMVGALKAVTVKLLELAPVPDGVVTLMGPVIAPEGTVAVMAVALATLKLVAVVPLKLTLVAPVKFMPVSVTTVPLGPLVGVKLVIVGVLIVKLAPLDTEPAGFVTITFPVVAPIGTVAVIDVAETTLNDDALTPLNFTAVVPRKFVPVIVTLVPTIPLVGVNDVMVGGLMTVKLLALAPVPAAVVTLIAPVDALAGTVAVI